jgi:hypothetical protein
MPSLGLSLRTRVNGDTVRAAVPPRAPRIPALTSASRGKQGCDKGTAAPAVI